MAKKVINQKQAGQTCKTVAFIPGYSVEIACKSSNKYVGWKASGS